MKWLWKSVPLILGLLLNACLNPRTNTDSELLSVSEALQATPRYHQAKRFDAFLRDELSPEEKKAYASECLKPNPDDIFCFGVLREAKIRRYQKKEKKLSEPHLRKKPEPITPTL